MQQSNIIEIFCCYAHEDKALLDVLKKHLSTLQKQNLVNVWDDGEIRAGTKWDQEIKEHLNKAKIILLLISPSFINSSYSYDTEMRRASERYEQKDAMVISVILRPLSDWEGVSFGDIKLGDLQALPSGARAVTTWNNRDSAWTNVVKGIGQVIKELPPPPAQLLPVMGPPSPQPTSRTRKVTVAPPENAEKTEQIRKVSEERASHAEKEKSHLSGETTQSAEAEKHTPRPQFLSGQKGTLVCVLVVVVAIIFGVVVASMQSASSAHQLSLDATATSVAANLYPSYLPGSGKLALSDPLNKPIYWQSGSNANFGGSCLFSNGAYHIVLAKGGNFFCQPPTNTFSNLAVEVNMTIIQGDCGGVWFRGYPNGNGPSYLFQVCQSGQYALYLYGSPTSSSIKKLLYSTSPAIRTGQKQSNLLAVIAIGTIFDLYVNQQKIASTSDSALGKGEINFDATGNGPTEVAFRNVEVWTP